MFDTIVQRHQMLAALWGVVRVSGSSSLTVRVLNVRRPVSMERVFCAELEVVAAARHVDT
jgi:DNA-binding winged helix-turn-helix (wHTH) protein